MAKIFYSMSGEGRGHAARVRTMTEHLRHEHQLVLFAPNEAYDFLAPIYNTPAIRGVEVRRLPGLKFYYTDRRLDLTKSIFHGVKFLGQLRRNVRDMAEIVHSEKPDLIVSDFEPILPKAGRKCDIPVVSLNHQDFLLAYDLSSLPPVLQRWAWMMSFVVKAHHVDHAETIVSSFFKSRLRPGFDNVVQVGPLLRPDVCQAQPSEGGFILSYLRKATPDQTLELLKLCDRPVKVYGLGKRPADGPVTFHEIDENRFTEDFIHCDALVGAAGNQSLGEAIYLGKPVLALPESSHHEQRINSHFLKQMGAGSWTSIETFAKSHLTSFLDGIAKFRANLARYRGLTNGNPPALAAIRKHLPATKLA
ncbi:glycosyltransferase family protein [Blastopirellula marina]|uniref:Teichoic acid biosynthesis protein n=1 Tax=Blastopirellula marina TaxID=124 RepID=A0A2S8GEH8_9BACT|nr:glycosyltransferase family protein [Blastopirellula marina]PQO42862.1 teichoic acid biosynthesis protein [Blastopirellula marina]PTL46628.1 teichoic acid biosynthesis protein [Blastopirellula marina]